MQITIYASGIPFNGETIAAGLSLGGSESSAYYLARALGLRGHEVRLYTASQKEGIWDGINYQWHGTQTQAQPLGERFHFWTESMPCDLLIIQRTPGFAYSFNCRVGFWWLHDLALRSQEAAALSGLWQVDRVLTVSEWHRRQVLETWQLDLPRDGLKAAYAPSSAAEWVTALPNGVDMDVFDRPMHEVAYTAKRLMPSRRSDDFSVLWCSRPERGLANLLDIAESLAESAPRVRFHLCGYGTELGPNHPLMPLYAELQRRVKQAPNVVELGCLGKADLADVMRSCDAWLYPTTFEETSCITAMEAQAAGMYCVTTDAGALPETLAGYRQHVCVPLEHGEVRVARFADWLRSAALQRPDRGLRRITRTWDEVAGRLLDIHADTARGYSTADYLTDRQRHSDTRFLRWLVEDKFAGDPLIKGDSVLMSGVRAELTRYENHDKPALMRAYYQAVWDEYQAGAEWWQLDATPMTARFLAISQYLTYHLDRATQPCRVLDYGCSYGNYTIPMAEQHKGHEFVGYDFLESMVTHARAEADRRRLDNVEFTAEHPSGKFDVILIDELLQHVWDVEAFVRALADEFAHDGTLWIGSTPHGMWEHGSRSRYGDYKMHVHHFERADIIEMLGRARNFAITYAIASSRLGNYVFRFEGKPDVVRIDYERKLRALRPRQSVSLCVILRNAAGSVESMLESARSLVDEVVVGLDRTTTDSTADRLLAACGAYQIPVRIMQIDSPLQSGFDVARNATVDGSAASWILWLDGDEVLLEASGMECLLRNNSWTAYAAAQTHHSDAPPGVLTTDYPTRMFRRRAGCRFFGRVHEHPETAINDGPGRATNPAQFQISHRGYSTEPVRRARFERNWPLMVRDRQDYPERKLGRWLWVRDLAHVNRYEQSMNAGLITEQMRQRALDGIATWEQVLTDGILRFVLESLQYYSMLVMQLNGGFEAWLASEMDGRRHEFKAIFHKREHYEKLVTLITDDQLAARASKYF
jgi:glycosyltransferase involved in cell wall biosynthesis/SAM-dependent methyltransferase